MYISSPYLEFRECVSAHTGLFLVLVLITPPEIALLKTPLNTDGHIAWDLGGKQEAGSGSSYPSDNIGHFLEINQSNRVPAP